MSDSAISISVDMKAEMRSVGTLRMKPTVSERFTGLPLTRIVLLFVESVVNIASDMAVGDPVSLVKSVDLPAFV